MTDQPIPIVTQSPKRRRTNKHKLPHNRIARRNQQIIWRRIVPNFTAILNEYHNEQTFSSYVAAQHIDATIDTWIPSDSDPSLQNGNSTDAVSTLLTELESLLHTFPEIQHDEILNHLHSLEPMSFLALDNANDTLTRSQMLRAPDKDHFLQAEDEEIHGLLKMNTWRYRRISSLPPHAQIINSVWSYRRKRTVDGHLIKHKARLCADGRQQQYGVDYFESYAPVITWTTVRLVLLLSVLLNLHCRQVDFTQAFPQADIDTPVFLRMPAGWRYTDEDGNTDYCLELQKNLYGTKQAARGWFLHLRAGLLSKGFQ